MNIEKLILYNELDFLINKHIFLLKTLDFQIKNLIEYVSVLNTLLNNK